MALETKATLLFNKQLEYLKEDNDLWDAAFMVFFEGRDPINDEFPFEDILYDYYDNSVELKDTDIGFILTNKQVQFFKDYGFSRMWVCYKDKTEPILVK